MIEPTGCVQCYARSGTYCDRCDLLVGLPGLHVIRVVEDGPCVVVTVESPPTPGEHRCFSPSGVPGNPGSARRLRV